MVKLKEKTFKKVLTKPIYYAIIYIVKEMSTMKGNAYKKNTYGNYSWEDWDKKTYIKKCRRASRQAVRKFCKMFK